VRQLRGSDKEFLLRVFERLGDASRYRRFLAPRAELTEARAHRDGQVWMLWRSRM
jgi:hypothetical protein